MEKLLSAITAATTLSAIASTLVPLLQKQSSTTLAFLPSSGLPDPLSVLDPASHSAGYLFILLARLETPNPALNHLFPLLTTFVHTFDPAQLKLIPTQVRDLLRLVLALTESLDQPALAIPVIGPLAFRLTAKAISSHHATYIKLIIATRSYHDGLLFLTHSPNLDLNSHDFPITYLDNLYYHYYGGIIFALSRDYTNAAKYLEIAVSAPGPGVSALQLDAYKKLILVQLLAKGKISPLPKYTSSAVVSAAKNHCTAYVEFAHAYDTLDHSRLNKVLEKHSGAYVKDMNIGLIQLCQAAVTQRLVQRLTRTFCSISLAEVAVALGRGEEDQKALLPWLRGVILTMIHKKEIFATITSPTTSTSSPSDNAVTGFEMINFFEDPEPFDTHKTIESLKNAISLAKELDYTMADDGMEIGRSKDFITKAFNASNSSSGGGINGGAGGLGSMGSMMGEDLDIGSTTGFGAYNGGGGADAGEEWEADFDD